MILKAGGSIIFRDCFNCYDVNPRRYGKSAIKNIYAFKFNTMASVILLIVKEKETNIKKY